MPTIYGMADSGNCYKPRLLLALLGQPFRHAEVSWLDGGTDSAAYRAKTPIGKIPLLETDDGRLLPESNAILCFLGEGTRFVPADPFVRAQMLSWLFWEQYSHEPNIAVRRSLMVYPEMADVATPERLEATLAKGNRALAVMEQRLAEADWLAGDAVSLADLCLYAYTHLAGDGGFDLGAFPAVSRWLLRVEALDGFRPIGWLPD